MSAMDKIIMFPKPVWIKKLDIDADSILELIKKENYYSIDNNTTRIKCYKTYNLKLLKDPGFEQLNEQAQLMVDEINRDYLKCVPGLKCMTSWATKTEPGGMGYPHQHNSSIISAVYYPSEPQSIAFEDPNTFNKLHPMPLIKERTEWNSANWTLSTRKNFLIMYYSNTVHQLCYNDQKENRYSVAFDYVQDTRGNFDLPDDSKNEIEYRRKIVYGD